MKKILFTLIIMVITVGFVNAAVNLDNGDYVNYFGYIGDLDDAEAYDLDDTYPIDVREGARFNPPAGGQSYILYKFTRTDISKVGLVVLKGRHDEFNNSWLVIGWGTDPANLTEDNMTNVGGKDRHQVVQIPIPIGEATYYVKVRQWDNSTLYGWLRYIKAFADMDSYNAGTIHELRCGVPFVDQCDAQEATDAVAYSSANCNTVAYDPSPTDPQRGIALNYPSSDGVRYRFTGTAEKIANTYFTFTGTDDITVDGSWFNVQVNDFAGNQLYMANLAMLNGGPNPGRSTYTINIADISALAGATEFEIRFFNSCCAGTGYFGGVRLIYLEVGVDPLIGDFNSDCDVNLLDMAILSDAWTGI